MLIQGASPQCLRLYSEKMEMSDSTEFVFPCSSLENKSHCLSSAQIHLKFTFCILSLLLSTFGEYIYIDVTKLDDFKRGNELFAVVRAHLMYTW